MPLTAPNLDDRTYSDIVAEAKTLIPRYAPEWTNFNESDPGITLVELFAWMTEILAYRLNQVPDLNYIKFLQLIGIELQAAQPATADLTFSVARPDIVSVIVPEGTQVAAAGSSTTPIIFETDEDLIAIGAILAGVQSFDGTSYTVLTNQNDSSGQWFYPFGQNPQAGSALLIGFSSPVTFPTDQINLAVSLYQDPLSQPIFQSGAAIPPPAALAWEYYDGSQWVSMDIDSDGTRSFSQNGHVLFPGPGANVQAASLGSVPQPLYWFRARIVSQSYETPPQIVAIVTNTIGATQAITFADEILGASNGLPNQSFTLTNTPVAVLATPVPIANADGTQVTVTSVQLAIDEGKGSMVWQQVDDFFSYGPDDRVYVLDLDTGVITMGDGENGRIPIVNQSNTTSNVVAQSYRSGGGSQGNVGAGTITQLQTFVQSINSVTNNNAATGGTDEETLADAQSRAAQALQSKSRAVTTADFESLAMQAPGGNVGRANAIPLFHPNFPNGQVPGVVTVIVVPNSPAANPTPNQTTLQAVCTYLDACRLLTSELFVVGPVYRKIKIQVELIVAAGSDLATVKNAVQANLVLFFSPLQGGNTQPGVAGTGWPFGGEIYYSDVYRVIIQTPGVQRIQDNQLLIYLDDQLQTFCRDVAINQGELLYSDPNGHVVDVSYATTSS